MKTIEFAQIGYPRNWNMCVVVVDGSYLPGCIFADAYKGIVKYYDTDDNRNITLDEAIGLPRTQVRYGRVQIYECNSREEMERIQRGFP